MATERVPPSPPALPGTLAARVVDFVEWTRVAGYAETTAEVRRRYLSSFCAWCQERSITRPEEVTRPVLLRYQRKLFYHRKRDGKPLSWSSQHGQLVALRAFMRWTWRSGGRDVTAVRAVDTATHPDWRGQGYPWYRAIWVECAELLDHYGWKWWKHQTPDLEQVQLELVDIWHFGLSDLLARAVPAAQIAAALRSASTRAEELRTSTSVSSIS